MRKRAKGAIGGIVQGVGFRPFVYRLARRCGLSGYVVNTPQGVEIEVEGPEAEVARFFQAVTAESPPLARIASIEQWDVPLLHDRAFEIRESRCRGGRSTLISPDVSVCADCLAELRDPQDRRYGYPFINCTNCGPRYTIIEDVPYDRAKTTMKGFRMCPACQKEYRTPGDRRFHAQPNACWDCGPRLTLHQADGRPIACPDPLEQAVCRLKEGRILALKGLGGFHLAVDAARHRAVVRLRRRKHREEKPLALMVRDLEAARALAHLSPEESELLLSHQRPIVLLRKRRTHGLSPQVAPRNRYFGIMLPYTPLHALVMAGGFRALVMTSGNISEEPINIDNEAALLNLRGIADCFLTHNRDIHLRSDDSIGRVVEGAPRLIRRSRGYVPVPVFLPETSSRRPAALGLGAELKNTVCLTRENRAFLSQHVGDMENLETFEFFRATISHLQRILEIEPRVLVHDRHPDYLSSKFAKEQAEVPVLAVQHHHAHVVSCLAENGSEGPVIGLALDGTGLGSDGRIWGGEVLFADLVSFRRAAHLEYVPLPGGDAAARAPWRTALSFLLRAYGEALFDLPLDFVRRLDRGTAGLLIRMIRGEVNSPLTSSCGRLFDAVSALVGVCSEAAYEGQAAMELEMCQNLRARGGYPWRIEEGERPWVLSTDGIVRGVVEDLRAGLGRGEVSRRFHNTVIEMFAGVCLRLREETGIGRVALSGGAFQNVTLLTGLNRLLHAKGFEVLSHRLVPANDGGLSLGQAVYGSARLAGVEGVFGSEGQE